MSLTVQNRTTLELSSDGASASASSIIIKSSKTSISISTTTMTIIVTIETKGEGEGGKTEKKTVYFSSYHIFTPQKAERRAENQRQRRGISSGHKTKREKSIEGLDVPYPIPSYLPGQRVWGLQKGMYPGMRRTQVRAESNSGDRWSNLRKSASEAHFS